jgi:transcriptional regulator of NAD metabolism
MAQSQAGSTRREGVLDALRTASAPLSGAQLARRFGVSRQVIVQDVALLRTQGHPIEALHAGYVLKGPAGCVRLVKVRHSEDQIEDEMCTVVDLGGALLDTVVNHRVYGTLSAPLNVRNRRDVARFIEDMRTGVSSPLSRVTDGYHYHHIEAESEAVLDEIEAALARKGYLARRLPYENDLR